MIIDKLHRYLENGTILGLLEDQSKWDSLIINRRKPHTYRIFTWLNNDRICLHMFNVCDKHEAFSHPHPWPAVFKILKGAYRMSLGRSPDRKSDPVPISELIMTTGSYYSIEDPLVWHSVIPLHVTYTVMLNESPWDTTIAHTKVRTTKGKDLDKIDENELKAFLAVFKGLLL